MEFSEAYPDTSSSVALAARTGDLTRLKLLIDQGKSTDSQDNRGWRPIHEAAYWNQIECLKSLVLFVPKNLNCTTFEGETPLLLAVQSNSISAVQHLLESGAHVNIPNNEDVTPLHVASSKGFTDIVEVLIQHGANLNMIDYGHYTPLHEASIAGHSSVVQLLLSNGADKTLCDSHGRSPLFCACQSHSCESVSQFIPSSKPWYFNQKATDGATPVMLASQSGCINCVKLLIDCGADPNLKANDGVMAVHLALIGNHQGVLRFLLHSTDHSFIEQSCLASTHKHPSVSLGRSWNEAALESVNIFTLAVTYQRFELLETLIEASLDPDRFPFQWRFEDVFNHAVASTKSALIYEWATPLSFILSTSPFTDQCLKAVQLLVGSGSNLQAPKENFVPPFMALTTNLGWTSGNPSEIQMLFKALEFIELHGAFENLVDHLLTSNFIYDVLVTNLQVLLFIIHKGYVVNLAKVQSSQLRAYYNYFARLTYQSKYLTSMTEAGLLREFDAVQATKTAEFDRNSLKKMSRMKVYRTIALSKKKFRISDLGFQLPRTLLDYLCFHDVKSDY